MLRSSRHDAAAVGTTLARREPTQLIGRADDIAAVRATLANRPIVTICGPGGVGKTRLAMAVAADAAEQFAHVAIVELAAVRDPEATVPLVACAFDVEQRQHLTLERTIEEFIQDRPVLLLLDNCEHVLAAVVPLVQRLCRHCLRLTVLATGREPLGLAGESVHLLAPLGVPAADSGDEARAAAAVQLFADRAAEARPGFQLDDRALGAVAEICRRLDGLPLAIELAAARMRSIGVEALAARLDQRFALLTGQRAGIDPRHRSLYGLVEWSYELLDPVDREAFTHLSVFAGTFDLDAAEAVCRPADAPNGVSAGTVIELVDKSMVQLVDPDEPRYRLLETLRDFGQERLRATGSMAPVEQRHREWFLDLAERAAVGLDSAEEGRWAARVDRDLDNFRAAHGSAVQAGDVAVAARLVATLHEYSFRRVRYEIASWGEATMQMEGFARSPSAPVVVAVAAYGRWVRGDLDDAVELARRSLGLTSELGVPSSGLAERVLGNALFFSGETQQALRWMERMVAVAEEGDSPAALTHALYMSSVAATSTADPARGAMLAERAKAAAERHGSPTARAQAAYADGLARRASDSEEAERILRRAADLGEEGGNRWIRAFALTEVHWLSAQHGRVAEGLRGFAEVIDLWYRGGDWANQWLSMRHVLGIFADLGAHQRRRRAPWGARGRRCRRRASVRARRRRAAGRRSEPSSRRARRGRVRHRRAPRRSVERRRHRRLRACRDRPLARRTNRWLTSDGDATPATMARCRLPGRRPEHASSVLQRASPRTRSRLIALSSGLWCGNVVEEAADLGGTGNRRVQVRGTGEKVEGTATGRDVRGQEFGDGFGVYRTGCSARIVRTGRCTCPPSSER